MARTRRTLTLMLAFGLLLAVGAGAQRARAVSAAPNGWYWPTGKTVSSPAPGWLQYRPTQYSLGPAWHVAWDDVASHKPGDPCYSLGWGKIVLSRMDVSGYGPGGSKGGAMVVRYQTSDGTYFSALYGHVVINLKKFPVGTKVTPGQLLCALNKYNPAHLHFGVHLGTGNPKPLPWTKPKFVGTVSMLMGHTYDTTKTASGKVVPETYGFTDPAAFLAGHTPWIAPPSSLTAPSVPASAAAKASFRGSGILSPKRPAGSKNIQLICQHLENGKWVKKATFMATDVDATASHSSYVASGSLAMTGSWRIQALAPGNMDWAATQSGWSYITVK